MRQNLLKKLAVLTLATLMLLTGCSRATQPQVATEATVGKVEAKPPLVIPERFENEEAKRLFILKALNDQYYAELQPVLQASIQTNPDARSYSLMGTTQYNLKDYPAAIDSWTKAADLNPHLAAEMHNNVGNALRDQKQVEEALAKYRKALEIDQNLWTAAVNAADLLRTQGRMTEAISVLEAASFKNKEIQPLTAMLASYRALQAEPQS